MLMAKQCMKKLLLLLHFIKASQKKSCLEQAYQFQGDAIAFPITAPNWRAALENLPHGNYAANNVAQTNQGDIFLFTVSLGEPFQPNRQNKSFCYKLVAAVINATQLVNQLK